ncbi:MAG: XrtA-associated ATPase [Gammaproteobacteria bacterium]|nr:XrtA-associated ATPase [Gammaproteobacteria bacterium]MBU1414883.1 XrtA-associated ATPase [Gammaproteobacteria bacterium]
MYEEYYGLTEKPFQSNPDPSFYFGSRQHRRAMAYLEYGLHRNEGFIVITGEIGAGKTTLVRSLLSKLDPEKFIAAHLVSTQLDADNALRLVASGFGVPTSAETKADLLVALEAFLVNVYRGGKRCLLVVDEAQNLSMQAVEELRMLSNFQLNTHALLQSFLVGQPEFRYTLQSPQLTQLRQRVIAACHIGPMDAKETQAYIEHRLTHCGWTDSPSFSADAFPAIYESSGGIPRRINAVCDRLLLSGFLSNVKAFSEVEVMEVAREIENETLAPGLSPPPAHVATARDASNVDLSVSLSAHPRSVVDALVQEDQALRLIQVEERILRVEAALEGLLHNNTNSLALLGRLVESIEQLAGETGKDEKVSESESRRGRRSRAADVKSVAEG